ncbi:MAG: hypothetical protein ABIQ93_11520, partial [Saprospiraceae bacterium]
DTIHQHYFAYTDASASFICDATAILRKNRDTVVLNCRAMQYRTISPNPPLDSIIVSPPVPLNSIVTMTLPQKTGSVSVSVNGQAIVTKMKTGSLGNYVIFKVPRSRKMITVRAKDEFCTYLATGIPSTAKLKLNGQSTCKQRRIEMTLNKDLQKILQDHAGDVVIEARTNRGELLLIPTPENSEPFYFYVPNSNLDVLLMLNLSSGARVKICAMKLNPGNEAVLKPRCSCDDCLIKIKPL